MSSLAPDNLPPVPALPPALLEEVQRDCAALARARRRRWSLFAAVALAAMVGIGLVSGWKGDGLVGPGCGSPLHGALVAGFAVAGLALIALAFGLKLPAGRLLRPVPLIGVGVGLGVLAAISALYGMPVPGHGGLKCLLFGGAVSLGLVVLALGLGREVMRRHAPSAGLFGVGVGLLALIPLSLACHDGSMAHLMLWHGLIPVVGGGLGMLVWWLAGPR